MESVDKKLLEELSRICLSLFRKNFFGVYHGVISAKLNSNKFLINKKSAIFDEIDENSFLTLYSNKDYRWKDASIDSDIHLNIYKNIHEAKFIIFTMPPYTTSYSLEHNKIIPKDYFGNREFNSLKVYDPKNFEDWYERADIEIYRYLKENRVSLMPIRGYGVYAYGRDLNALVKRLSILENSCRLLHLSKMSC